METVLEGSNAASLPIMYVQTDHLVSSVVTTRSDGSVEKASRVVTTPYGEIFAPIASAPSAWDDQAGFTGYVRDADTDLIYM